MPVVEVGSSQLVPCWQIANVHANFMHIVSVHVTVSSWSHQEFLITLVDCADTRLNAQGINWHEPASTFNTHYLDCCQGFSAPFCWHLSLLLHTWPAHLYCQTLYILASPGLEELFWGYFQNKGGKQDRRKSRSRPLFMVSYSNEGTMTSLHDADKPRRMKLNIMKKLRNKPDTSPLIIILNALIPSRCTIPCSLSLLSNKKIPSDIRLSFL